MAAPEGTLWDGHSFYSFPLTKTGEKDNER